MLRMLRNQHNNKIIHKVGVILISIHGVHNHNHSHKQMFNNNNLFLKNNIYHNNNNLYHNRMHLNNKIIKLKEMI